MMPDFVWETCPLCGGTGTYSHNICQACMGEGGRWIPAPDDPDDEPEADEACP